MQDAIWGTIDCCTRILYFWKNTKGQHSQIWFVNQQMREPIFVFKFGDM